MGVNPAVLDPIVKTIKVDVLPGKALKLEINWPARILGEMAIGVYVGADMIKDFNPSYPDKRERSWVSEVNNTGINKRYYFACYFKKQFGAGEQWWFLPPSPAGEGGNSWSGKFDGEVGTVTISIGQG